MCESLHPQTKSERISDNITIIPYSRIQPELSPHQEILQETKDLEYTIQKFTTSEDSTPYQSTLKSLEDVRKLLPIKYQKIAEITPSVPDINTSVQRVKGD